ncbi:hypothetical protein IAT40_000318 [Kwoniella sp. CBS 6097]
MRFAPLLCAIPLIGSVFAAPTPIKEVSAVAAVEKRDVDVLAIVTELQADISAIAAITPTSVEAEVTVCLEAVLVAFNKCGQALGIELDVGLDADVAIGSIAKRQDVAPEAAKILAAVIAQVNVFVGVVSTDVAAIPVVAALLVKIDTTLCVLLNAVEALLVGVLSLVAHILLDLKCALAPVLAGVLGLLDGLVGGLLGGLIFTVDGLTGGLVGGLLGGLLG